ncbi:MAG: tetratricopeptide repeat protein [Bacteroidales bacterium]
MATKTIAPISIKGISLFLLMYIILTGNYSYAQTGFEYYNVALVKYNIRDYKGALDDLARVIEHEPSNPLAFNLRGMVKYSLEDISGAIEDYSRAIEIYSSSEENVKIKIHAQRGNIIESPVKPKPNTDLAVPYYNRALAKNDMENYSGAIEDYTSALENDPGMVTSYYNRGLARYHSDDLSGACSDWRTAINEGIVQAEELIRQYCPEGMPTRLP